MPSDDSLDLDEIAIVLVISSYSHPHYQPFGHTS